MQLAKLKTRHSKHVYLRVTLQHEVMQLLIEEVVEVELCTELQDTLRG